MSQLTTILIADDLTGSLDSIAPFAALGMDCVTAVTADGIDRALALSPAVLSVNLGTRELPPFEAQARASAATAALMAAAGPETLWIKKIDSRLKGPIAAEVAGMAGLLCPDHVLLCPAIPELGRVMSDGQLSGHGIVGKISVAQAAALGLPCDIPDAATDADLDRLAELVRPGTLVVAARGLAAALARRICPGRASMTARLQVGPVGFIVGSRDPVTVAQVAQIVKALGPKVIPAPDGAFLPVTFPGPFVIQATAGAGASGPTVSARLAQGVSQSLSGVTTLLVTGGETAAAVLQTCGIGVIRIKGEILPGLPLCRAIDQPDFPDIVTKSGGFGPPDTFVRLWQAAQELQGLS